MTTQTMQIGNRPCRIYGEAHAEYLLLQMTGEHELQSMESEVTAIAQSAHRFLFAAIPVESWNDALSPWEAPAVWFPGWMEYEQQHPIQAQRVYLSLGDKEEHTKNAVMAAVGDNIRTLHSRLIERGADCTLEWNSGGHFKDADLRTARAFQWVMEEHT